MFDIGWSELLLIAVVAIIVVGPKDLPPMLRATGRMVSKLRRTAGEFQNQFNEALREAELDGVKDSINEIRALNPMNEIRKSLDPIATAIGKPEPAKPVAVPAPEPVPPPLNQPAQPMVEADLKPAADPMPVAAAEAAKPARPKRKAKAAAADAATPAAAKKPAAKRAATVAVNGAESLVAADAVAVKKPRPGRATAAPKSAPASDVSAPVSENAAAAPAVPPPEERH